MAFKTARRERTKNRTSEPRPKPLIYINRASNRRKMLRGGRYPSALPRRGYGPNWL